VAFAILRRSHRSRAGFAVVTLKLWTIYKHPTDYPDRFVARQFVLDKPTENVIISPDIETLRSHFLEIGLSCITRSPHDEPQIVEVWL
jgi:hypothetical protein